MAKIVAVAGKKGGIGKTMTSVHLAAYLSGRGRTLLVDGDPNRSASDWRRLGEERRLAGEIEKGLPFEVVGPTQSARLVGGMDYVVMDTEAQPDQEDLEDIALGAHLIVLPTQPHRGALKVLVKTTVELRKMGRTDGYRVLLTSVPPRPSREGEEARRVLSEAGVPIFEAQITRRAVFPRSEDEGVAVYGVRGNYLARRSAWDEYRRVGKEVLAAL